ncbi:hypothetical protein CXB51_022079 [Gossypium anomalum]|uniref:NAC domain-containing protein n=1 Tax=Gossypium anomalum TaxID=47600 RepID=A0A8J6CSN0_9ROSI|nr:hypothetical protein CXB51_022079 [Gossypium anomalum]
MENLPPGFRFHPTDEELITYYLSHKVSDITFTSKLLSMLISINVNLGIFQPRHRWGRKNGKDKEIFRAGGVLVGMKKTLVFYKGRAPKGEKSNWVMHEYRLETNTLSKPQRYGIPKECSSEKPQPSSSSQPSLGSPCDANSIVNEFGDVELPNLNINANPSCGFNDIATPSYSNTVNHGHMNAMNLNLDFGAASLPSSLSWPSGILTPNLSMNSFSL